ncbi:sigma-54-dependent Fis family transcriptional regulator [Adhaeribacter aerolatus]|uniref:Sigma-54-dependent Fis family transcriptional regulator n=1 Tax=Adhaeribacter aerolatus TaxID=670289 RepID=A0A512ASR1_9BACT|nr:sigma-54 dependent transcriptional regulator [Adhaeribacter aerolatus]GEO02739.1 sigma-54-dependent Fis family transcriptional regulator [Adhaeribacter aerolatus]
MILIIDDDIAVRTSLSLLLKQAGYKTANAVNAREALKTAKEEAHLLEAVIMDMNFSLDTSGQDGLDLLQQLKKLIPQVPVILITGWGTIALAVEGIKAGAFDFITKPWSNEYLLQQVETALKLGGQEQTSDSISLSRKQLDKQYNFSKIVGEDPAFLAILRNIGQISATDASVLIEGESGTGKELIAEAIHLNSLRKNQPFVKVNLGGISQSLFESEMFGHKRGAFTDAKGDRVGRFEMANKGSIFLDEIGELDMNSQVKLLRVLQDRTYEVLGDSRPRKLDIRVVSATNRSLEDMVENNRFREDLFYRINLITIKLPALRERPGDIPMLVNYFIDNLKKIYNRHELTVTIKALNWLKQLPLPGNIRELKNLVERTVLISGKNVLEPEDFQAYLQYAPKKADKKSMPAVGSMTLEEMEATMIRKSMEFYDHNVSKVAKALGVSRGALYRRLDKFNIPYDAAD